MSKPWRRYSTGRFFDELITQGGSPRVAARRAVNFFKGLSADELQARRAAAELAIKEMGISFTVYTEGENIDRAWPFDMIPRVISAREWSGVSQGLAQRTRALNCFIDDIYNQQKILADGIVPADIVLGSDNYKAQCEGVSPRFGAWAHICGSDLVRDHRGRVFVF
jgi:uncharacterized circularly permuted ATP-grasp superfamily protein